MRLDVDGRTRKNMVIEPSEGSHAAGYIVLDIFTSRIFQDIQLPEQTHLLKWDMAYENSTNFLNDYQTIKLSVKDPNSDELLQILYQPSPGVDPLSSPMQNYSVDISEFSGLFIRIDIEIIISNNCLDVIFDNFRIE